MAQIGIKGCFIPYLDLILPDVKSAPVGEEVGVSASVVDQIERLAEYGVESGVDNLIVGGYFIEIPAYKPFDNGCNDVAGCVEPFLRELYGVGFTQSDDFIDHGLCDG